MDSCRPTSTKPTQRERGGERNRERGGRERGTERGEREGGDRERDRERGERERDREREGGGERGGRERVREGGGERDLERERGTDRQRDREREGGGERGGGRGAGGKDRRERGRSGEGVKRGVGMGWRRRGKRDCNRKDRSQYFLNVDTEKTASTNTRRAAANAQLVSVSHGLLQGVLGNRDMLLYAHKARWLIRDGNIIYWVGARPFYKLGAPATLMS